ncbi:MAG: hypothetical protein D6690_09305 [Nitrospirae bacterium]|nr:MAG: hypothetical protein D6690_09305 [Nitrospirota bacterium]
MDCSAPCQQPLKNRTDAQENAERSFRKICAGWELLPFIVAQKDIPRFESSKPMGFARPKAVLPHDSLH